MSALPPFPAPGRFKLSDGQTAAFALVDAIHAAIAAHEAARHAHPLDGQDDAIAAELRHEETATRIELWKALDLANVDPRELGRVLMRGKP